MIVALNRNELGEIMKKGVISTMNKTVKTQDIVKENLENLIANKEPLLANIDTTGMSKL